jgi:N-acyl amino acid synthase of PEP-CTERM/exosortase system
MTSTIAKGPLADPPSLPAGAAGHPAPPPPPASASSYFTGVVLDDDPVLLQASYALRYQVYCLERKFLSPHSYPDQVETDEFDQHSIHMGVINAAGELAATARLVQLTTDGLPSFDHCTFHTGVNVLRDTDRRLIEISRLAVSRAYNRRAGDEHFSLGSAPARTEGGERRGGGLLVMTLYRAIYQTSKRQGITDWMAATERSLQRLIVRSGFPFRQIGPETDYYGPVAPYLLDLGQLDARLLSGRFTALNGFMDGLEPEFRPDAIDAPTPATV